MIQVVAMERKSEGGLFAALDTHLHRVKLQDVFNQFTHGKGYLAPDELLDMIFELMPTLTKGDFYYFQVGKL